MPQIEESKVFIPSRLKNVSVGGHVAGAGDIIDDALNKTQDEINAIVLTPSSGIDDRLKTIEQGVTFEGTIETETNPENVVSPGAKVPTTNAVRGAIDVRTGYFACSTGGSTAAKTATAPGYVLTRGGAMRIWMEHANTADNATLNINSTGAKALFYNGERAGSGNSWEDEEVITVYYDETANSNAGAYYASNAQGSSKRKEIKALFIGNSVSQDHVGYLPWLLKNTYGNDIKFTICIAYKAGVTVKEYVENIIPGNTSLDIFSTADNTDVWVNTNNFPYANIWTQHGYFDLICFAGYFNPEPTSDSVHIEDVSYFAPFIEDLKSRQDRPFKLGYLLHQTYTNDSHTEKNAWERIVNGAKHAINNNGVSILFPCGMVTKIVNGDIPQSTLTNDNLHNQQGLPCIMGSYVIMEELSRYVGLPSTVINNQLRITSSIETRLNIPGPNGTLQIGTNAQYSLCQDAAIKAVEFGDYLIATNTQGWDISAEKIKYDNSQSGLVAENVQRAVDESLKFKGVEKVIVPRYLETKNGFMTSANAWLTPNSQRVNTHKSIPVVEGEWYKITANSENVTTYAFLQSDQVPSTNQQLIDLVAGTSVTSIGVGETKYIQIPTGCTYLALNEANITGENRLPAVFCKMELSVLNDKVGELDFRIDDVTEFGTIPIPYDIKVFMSPSSKQWLSDNNNYTGSFIWVQDSSLNYKITANANYNTRVVALTANTYTSGEVCDTFATGYYDSSEFCVNAGETRIVKFPAATKFLWVSFTEGSGVNTTPQYVGVEKDFELPVMCGEVCLFNGSTQSVLEIPCQITAGDILHIEVDKGDTSPYTIITTKYNDVVQEYLDYMDTSDVDKYVVVKSNADTIRIFSSVAASSFKVSKVQASLLRDIEFSEICNNIVEVSVQDGTPVPYFLINGNGKWQQGPHSKSYILDIPEGAKSMYVVPHGTSTFAFLNSNDLPESDLEDADIFDGTVRFVVREKAEYAIPNGCHYVAFTFHYYSSQIVTDAAPISLGFRFSNVEFLNKYKLEQPYSSIKLDNTHLIVAAETWYNKNSDASHKTDLSVAGTSIIRTRHSNALGKYYLYLSEDHTSNSPIYMAYSDNLLDWTYYGVVATQQGLIGTAGDIEWPSVIWDDFNSRYLLYTHCLDDITGLGYGQTEFICESQDGINWTYVKPFVTIPKNRFVGNFHNGYVKVHKDGGIWYGVGLLGGGDASQTTAYFSYDGINWMVDPYQYSSKRSRCLPYTNGDITGVGEAFIKDGEHLSINGKNYMIGFAGSNSSGTAERTAKIHIQEVLDNRIHRGKAYPLTSESQSYRDVSVFIDDDGEIYVLSTVKYAPLTSSHKRLFYVFISKLKK